MCCTSVFRRGMPMTRVLLIFLVMTGGVVTAYGQASGNVAYSQSGGNAHAEQNERNKRVLTPVEMPPSATTMFVEASVLMNVKADEYVAIFGINQECVTVPECNQQMDATVAGFGGELQRLGIGKDDLFVDFAAQNKIYSYQVTGSVAKQRLSGFELKKNIAIHYKDKRLLDQLVVA